jgi:EpsI family protein
MIARRDVLIGSACAVAAGAAYALKPRTYVSLLDQGRLDDVLPRSFNNWSSRDVGNLVAPRTEGTLASRLYSEVIQRIYHHGSTGAEIMMLVAHSNTQTNDLQLHRPETCYPFFGFTLSNNTPWELKLPHGVALPGRRLVASAPGRREAIMYWARLGEYMPVTAGQQRIDRLKTAMSGYVADGLLARFSALGPTPEAVWQVLDEFIPSFVLAVRAEERRVLIGTSRARMMAEASS